MYMFMLMEIDTDPDMTEQNFFYPVCSQPVPEWKNNDGRICLELPRSSTV